jgi:hypothetical protein
MLLIPYKRIAGEEVTDRNPLIGIGLSGASRT